MAATWIGGGTYGEFPVGSTASFPVRPLPYLAVPVLTHARNGDSIFRGLRRQLEKERPDLIVAYWMYPDAYAAVRAGHALGIPVVAGSRGSDLKVIDRNSAVREKIRQTVIGASAVLTVSRDLAEIARQLSGHPHVHSIPNGVDTSIFHMRNRDEARAELKLARDQAIVLFVGRLVQAKGVVQLLEAGRILKERQVPITVALIGDGPLESAMRRQAKRTGIAKQVLFGGTMAAERVALWLAAADVLCLPSDSEGCPNVVKEALSCGCPVVATAVGGVPEMLDPTCGILVENNAAATLADALQRGLMTPWNRGQIARTQTRGWDQVAEETLAICRHVLRDSGVREVA